MSGGPDVVRLVAGNADPYTLQGTNTWIAGDRKDGSVAILDPGPDDEPHRQAIHRHLESRRLSVDLILLTHGHEDHSGLVDKLHRDTGAPVGSACRDFSRGLPILDGAQALTAGTLTLRVIPCPGHTSDSVAVYVPQTGDLFTGDTVLGGSSTMIDFPDGNLADYLASLEKLEVLARTEEATRILPGHGPVLRDPLGSLRAYWRHRVRRMHEVRGCLAQGRTDAEEITRRMYPGLDVALVEGACLNVRATIDYLVRGLDGGLTT